jgi:hypothetical protein
MIMYLLNNDNATYVTDEVQQNNDKNLTRNYIYEMWSLMYIYMSTLLDRLQGNSVNIIKLNMIQRCHVYECL